MARGAIGRRELLALAGFGAGAWAVAGPARAVTTPDPGFTLQLLGPNSTYAPPTTLAGVADLYHRMTVPIGLGGAGPFSFVVDTGANQSVVSQELAEMLGLPIGRVQPLNGVAGVQNAPTTHTDLRIGSEIERDVTLSILPAKALGGSGLLGLDRLDGRQLTLDFQARTLRIDGGGRVEKVRGEVNLKARRRDGQLTLIDADLDGIPITCFLDSGAQNTIGNHALRGLAEIREPTSHWVQVAIVSATGQTIMAEMANLPHLRIGGMHLPNWPVAFAELHTFKLWDLVNKPAILLGVDVMSRFQSVCLDFARDEVRFRPPGVDS